MVPVRVYRAPPLVEWVVKGSAVHLSLPWDGQPWNDGQNRRRTACGYSESNGPLTDSLIIDEPPETTVTCKRCARHVGRR